MARRTVADLLDLVGDLAGSVGRMPAAVFLGNPGLDGRHDLLFGFQQRRCGVGADIHRHACIARNRVD